MEALEYAPFGNEARLAVAQKFLDEERGEALGEAEANRPEVRELVAIIEARQGKRHVPKECHVPECSCH